MINSKKATLFACFLIQISFASQPDYPQQNTSGNVTNTENKSVCDEDCKLPSPEQFSSEPAKKNLHFEFGDSTFEMANKIRIDGLYGVNLRLINNRNNSHDPQLDKIAWPGRHTLDSWLTYGYGRQTYGHDAIKFKLGVRNRGIWGDESSIFPVGKKKIKHIDALIGEHDHAVPRHVFWARELWLELSLQDMFDFCNKHSLTMGLFSFSLGRGIALGDAYETDLEFLGDYSELAIDQYAPGFLLSGEIIPCELTYGFYFQIEDNRSDTFDLVNDPVYKQRRGRRFDPARGFGSFDYFLAGHFFWTPVNEDNKKVTIEPYGFYHVAKEQKIVFIGQAEFKLGTIGLATEFECGNWEGGFDTAFNIGVQDVFAWDNNEIKEEKTSCGGSDAQANCQGLDQFVFTKVFTENPQTVKKPNKAPVTKDNTKILDEDKQFGQQFNGKQIDKSGLFNAKDRFSNPYKVFFKGGAMFVADAAYNFKECGVKVAGTVGFATGDEDPNKSLILRDVSSGNQTFRGFVPEEELYSGKRVQSKLFLAGQGKIPRPLSIPNTEEVEDSFSEFPTAPRAGFTNIVLTGAALSGKPCICDREWEVKTNVLGFWSYITETVFKNDKNFAAGRYFGTEWNITMETELLTDLRFFVIGAVFVPGSFYESFAGVPLKDEEKQFIASFDTGEKVKRVPILGHDTAYFVNMGFEFRF